LPSVDPAAVQGLVAQMATAAIGAAVLFGCDRVYKRHFLRYWIWSWLALLVSLAVTAIILFGRAAYTSVEPWRTLLNALGVSAVYLELVWILFGNREMAMGKRLPRTVTRWVPIAIGAATLVVVALIGPAGLRTRLAIRAGVKTVGYFGSALIVAYGSSSRGGLGRPLMTLALLGRSVEQAYFLLGGGLPGGTGFQLAHSGVVDLTLQLLLSLAMVLWLLEGERERAIVLSREREEAERARADATRFTGEIVSSAAQAIVALDRRLAIEVWNPFAETLFGVRAEEVLGKSAREVFPPPHDEMLGHIGRALEGETVFVSGVRSNLGRKPWCAITLCPRQGASGDITGVIALTSDITESKQAERVRACLHEIALIANGAPSLAVLFAGVHRSVAELVPASNLYVALRDEATVSFPYFADEREASAPPARADGRGLSEYVMRTETPLLATPEVREELRARGEIDELGPDYRDWLGVPLKTHRGVIGVLVVGSYEGGRYGPEERDLLALVSAQVAQAVERVRAEEAQAAQVRLTAEIVNGAVQGVVAFDRDFKIVLWNPYAERLTGWRAAEMMGVGLPELFRRAPPPDCEEKIARALRGEVQSAEYPVALPGNPWVSTLFSPLHAADGALSGGVLLVSDVTERKQAEADRARLETALLAAASDWKATFDAVDVLIVVLDAGGRVARLNRAAVELAKVSYGRSLGRPLLEVAEGEPWVTGAALAARLVDPGSRVAELARDRATGRVWGLSVTRFASPEGGDDRVVIVGRDITPVVRLEESLRRKEHMSVMGALVAGVAHEVRNPLFGISSTVDAFEARFGDVEKHHRYLTNLRTQVDRLRRLMSDLLEYGKPLTSEPSAESLAEVVAEAMRSCEPLARRSQVHLEDETAAELPRVSMDRSRMVQVVQNVLQNAIEHAGRGGRVCVETRAFRARGEERVELTVRDTGPGFQEADIPRLFEPFFTRRRGGTGLGLSIVQRIVEQTGGRVTAQNHPEGGALVTIELPAGEAPEAEVGRVRAAL
jgi:PAS domain S-box-containing protein